MNEHENKFAALTEQELQEINGGGTWEPIYGWGENGLYGGLRYNKQLPSGGGFLSRRLTLSYKELNR